MRLHALLAFEIGRELVAGFGIAAFIGLAVPFECLGGIFPGAGAVFELDARHALAFGTARFGRPQGPFETFPVIDGEALFTGIEPAGQMNHRHGIAFRGFSFRFLKK